MQAQEITNRVREIMKARKITQTELAAKLQVSQNQVSQYLAGTPRLDTILAIADALQIEPAELFQDTTPPAPALAACPHCGAPLKIIIK